jgi:hypothetical protein
VLGCIISHGDDVTGSAWRERTDCSSHRRVYRCGCSALLSSVRFEGIKARRGTGVQYCIVMAGIALSASPVGREPSAVLCPCGVQSTADMAETHCALGAENCGGRQQFVAGGALFEHGHASTPVVLDAERSRWELDRARMERRVRALWKLSDSDADAEVTDVLQQFLDSYKSSPGARALSETEVVVFETVCLLSLACFGRATCRESCEYHGWRRLRAPELVSLGEELEVCGECKLYCAMLEDESKIALYAQEFFPDVAKELACLCGYDADGDAELFPPGAI